MPKPNRLLNSLLPLFIIFTLIACSQKKRDDLAVIKTLDESLSSANKVITMSTETILKALEDKTTEPASSERAKIWFPKAELIATISHKTYDIIANKKIKSGLEDSDVNEIYQDLVRFKEELLNTDPDIREGFKDNFGFINRFVTVLCTDSLAQAKQLNKNISTELLRASLTSLQSDIKKIENKTISFCNQKCGSIIDYFDTYSILVGQNSTILQAGDKLEIKAGIGSFSKSGQPQILINGKEVPVGEEGFSLYKMNVQSNPGKYRIPIRISFTNWTTGKKEDFKSYVEYTVAKECNDQ